MALDTPGRPLVDLYLHERGEHRPRRPSIAISDLGNPLPIARDTRQPKLGQQGRKSVSAGHNRAGRGRIGHARASHVKGRSRL